MPSASKAFLRTPRRDLSKRPIAERIDDDQPVYLPVVPDQAQEQATRCMDCGVPFCQSGCPLGNVIPDWNVLVSEGNWREAYERLAATNNFPEFTGRICPAPCESACVAGIVSDPVAIEQVEQAIIERAFDEGWVQPEPPETRTGFHVAVVGSGPAGLAAAQQLNRAGHRVTVYERDVRPGGLLRSGVPDFKLEQRVIDRRLDLLEREGIKFQCSVEVGVDLSVDELRETADAVVLCIGALKPRKLDVPGRDLNGVHFAWPFLHRHSRSVAGDPPGYLPDVSAAGKRVVVLGGGDTASDCIGTAHRQGAASIVNITHGPPPPEERPPERPWPYTPGTLTVSSSHEEGVERLWLRDVVGLEGDGDVTGVRLVDVEWHRDGGKRTKRRVPGSEHMLDADLVLIAIGYTGPDEDPLLDPLGVRVGARGTIDAPSEPDGLERSVSGDGAPAERLPYETGERGVFAAGDARRGASLIVWAIVEGRECARAVDRHLTGDTSLPTRGGGDLEP
jgi:glutamate synthase (NADPH/NADH) small chain